MLETTNTLSDEELAELTIRSFTLPLNNMTLLVPSTVIAEVLDYREVEPTGHMPDWLLGMLSWRGRNVPVVCFEKMLGQEQPERKSGTRYVVCNTLNGSTRIPFIAMQIEGMPHLRMVTNEMLTVDSDSVGNDPVVEAYLLLQGGKVILPNMDVMEKMLENLGISAD